MVKLDTDFPTDYTFPQTFWAVYAQCVFEAGLAPDIAFDNVVLNGVWDNGIISSEYTDYIYANSCRKLVSGMAEWNGGYACINDDGKLQIDKFSQKVVREYSSGDLMELDYSDETVTFTKIRTSQKNKTYELGTDDGYTLVLNNQYISYGLDDSAFELYLTKIYDYYKGFTLTPMSFTLSEPDLNLRIGDRISVFDEEEQITVYGNVSKIEISGNLSMSVTCGGFENVSSSSNYIPESFSAIQQSKQEVKAAIVRSEADLTEYKYISDNSVKFNGVTYTVEKDADTGLISKVSDSSGNEFEPEISERITDVATHNAVFWAVTMCRGLPKQPFKDFMPEMSGVNWYYVGEMISSNSAWDNLIQGGEPIVLTNATATDGIVTLAAGGYGLLNTNHSGDITIYAIAANTSTASKWTQYAGMGNNSKSDGRELTIQSFGIEQGIFCTTGLWGGSSSSSEGNFFPDTLITDIMDYHLVVLRRTKNLAEAFFDGVKSSNSKSCYDFSSTFAMGGYYRGSSWDGLNSSMMKYKFIAIAECAQSDEQILKNSTWLINKYI